GPGDQSQQPPTRRTTWRIGSYVMRWPARADGLSTGVCCVQSVPSHVQVSSRMPALQSGSQLWPPKRMICWWFESYVSEEEIRPEGLLFGLCCVQSVPS